MQHAVQVGGRNRELQRRSLMLMSPFASPKEQLGLLASEAKWSSKIAKSLPVCLSEGSGVTHDLEDSSDSLDHLSEETCVVCKSKLRHKIASSDS